MILAYVFTNIDWTLTSIQSDSLQYWQDKHGLLTSLTIKYHLLLAPWHLKKKAQATYSVQSSLYQDIFAAWHGDDPLSFLSKIHEILINQSAPLENNNSNNICHLFFHSYQPSPWVLKSIYAVARSIKTFDFLPSIDSYHDKYPSPFTDESNKLSKILSEIIASYAQSIDNTLSIAKLDISSLFNPIFSSLIKTYEQNFSQNYCDFQRLYISLLGSTYAFHILYYHFSIEDSVCIFESHQVRDEASKRISKHRSQLKVIFSELIRSYRSMFQLINRSNSLHPLFKESLLSL